LLSHHLESLSINSLIWTSFKVLVDGTQLLTILALQFIIVCFGFSNYNTIFPTMKALAEYS
jgi:hypothetical protein